MPTREEHDSLGPVTLPADALYGAQTARAIHNFPISGMRAHPQLIRAIAMVKMAAAGANRSLGLLTEAQSDSIIAAAEEIVNGYHHDHFPVDVFQAGAGVSFHMNANEVIANRANQILGAPLGSYAFVHPNDQVNYGQSTNDVFPTAMRLSALLALEDLYPVLNSLTAAFSAKGKEFHDIMKSGRTHMQDAVPMRLGQEFAAYAVAIAKAHLGIATAADTLRELGLGGSAVGTGINTHPDYRARAIANLAAISERAVAPCGRHALRHAILRAHGHRLRLAAHARARDHPHLERPAPAQLRPQHRPRRDHSSPRSSPAPASCPARSTPSSPSSPPWLASRSLASTPPSPTPCRPASSNST